jgi:hypothetical protein
MMMHFRYVSPKALVTAVTTWMLFASTVTTRTVFVLAADQDPMDDVVHPCGLYLSVSSTSTTEATNWGLFLGVGIDGTNVAIGSPEVAIVISHLRVHNENRKSDDFDVERLVDYFESFLWVPATAGAKYELSTGRAIAAIPGGGVLASYSKKSTNTDWKPISTYRRPIQGEQTAVAHPNRGAISPFYHCQIVSTVPSIKAGSEIFMEYGESWGEDQDDEELTKDDFVKVDETVHQMIQFFDKYNDTLDTDSALEIYSFLTHVVLQRYYHPTQPTYI